MSSAGSYQIGAELGRGALGRVVIVTGDRGERLAGKILHDSHKVDGRSLARFAGEAKLAAGLRHPNIASVEGLVEIDGESVLLMELVEGDSLAGVIARDAPLPEDRIVKIGAQIAAGLEAAHHAGLIHRDLKPDNVLIAEDGEVAKIVDFGMARATSFAGVDAGAFAVVGTPDYMAPESIDPLAVDARSDLYALGCILYEMATGAPPHSGATAFAILEAHREAPLATGDLEAMLSAPLVELIVALLQKLPADRPQSAAQVAGALEAMARQDSALALLGRTTIAAGGECARCGTPATPEVTVCFGCGLEQVRLEHGAHTVFVTGPGAVADKIDSASRQKLVDWLLANPGVGIAPGRLEKRVPRLPFVLATRVSEASAQALARSLESLGFETAVREGGRLSLAEMRKKGLSLGGRYALIGVSGLIYGLHTVLGPMFAPIIGLGGLLALGGGFFSATRSAASQTGEIASELPPALAEPLARLAAAVAGIEHSRHRDSLRGVVQRALAIRSTGRDDLDAHLGELIDLATAAVCRIDAIDTALAAGDLRNPTESERARMLERDALAARLLEITAFLDATRARLVALGDRGDTELEDLRAHIDALEEIEAL